jgi:hypothetical protein
VSLNSARQNYSIASARPLQELSVETAKAHLESPAVMMHLNLAKNNAENLLIVKPRAREEYASLHQTAVARPLLPKNALLLQIQKAASLLNMILATKNALLEQSATLFPAKTLE